MFNMQIIYNVNYCEVFLSRFYFLLEKIEYTYKLVYNIILYGPFFPEVLYMDNIAIKICLIFNTVIILY